MLNMRRCGLENDVHNPSTEHRVKKIIAVYSSKGGVGKSTIAKELAALYSTKYKVLIIDMDIEFGDIATLFNVESRAGMMNSIRRLGDYQDYNAESVVDRESIICDIVVKINEELDIIPAPGNLLDAREIGETDIENMIDVMRDCAYDVIIVDTANTADDRTMAVLRRADKVVLVESLDTSTYVETMALFEFLRDMQFDISKMSMVINTVPSKAKELDIHIEELIDLIGIRFITTLPQNYRVRLQNNLAMPLVWMHRDSEFARGIRRIAEEFMPNMSYEKKDMFSKIFKK